MSTFKEMQDDVLLLCQELQGQTDFNLVVVKRQINRAYHNFCRKTKCLQSEFDLTADGSQSYAIDDEIYDFHHLRYSSDFTSEYGKYLVPYPGGYSNLPKNTSTGDPTYYWLRGIETRVKSEIGFYPIPSSGTIRGWCSVLVGGETAAELSADGDVPKFKESWHDALVHYTTWKLFSLYSHRKREWDRKALNSKAFYEADIEDYTFNNSFGGELSQVHDVFNDYNWLR